MAQKISDQKLNEVNLSKDDSNNEFFKNLYSNKLNTSPPDFVQTPAIPPRNLPTLPERNAQPQGPPIVNSPPNIDYRSDKPQFDVSNIEVDDSISKILKDQSEADKVNFSESSKNFNEIKESRENNSIERISKNALDNFYQNDSYVFERRKNN